MNFFQLSKFKIDFDTGAGSVDCGDWGSSSILSRSSPDEKDMSSRLKSIFAEISAYSSSDIYLFIITNSNCNFKLGL